MDSIRSIRLETIRPHHSLMATFDQSLLDVMSKLGQQANFKIENKLDKIIDLLKKGINKMSVEFDAMASQVQANSDAIDSAIVLINGIADRITAAGVDPAKLQALTDELKAKDAALAAAVVANTPTPTV